MGLFDKLLGSKTGTRETQDTEELSPINYQNAVMVPSPKFCLPPLDDADFQNRKKDFNDILEPESTRSCIFESFKELVDFRPDLADILFKESDYPNIKYQYYRFDVRECGDHALVLAINENNVIYYHEIPRVKSSDCLVFVRITSDLITKPIREDDPGITFYGFL